MHDPTIAGLRINGGRLCLDFINTATWAEGVPEREFLTSFDDLLTWGGRENLLTAKDIARQRAGSADAFGQHTLVEARALRQAMRDLFEPGRPAERAVEACRSVNAALANLAPGLHLEAGRTGPRLTANAHPLGALLAPLIVSALDLAASPARAQIHVCPGEGCHWLFLDLSRNGTRRWCSMESCGNKAKARAHYLSHRGAGDARAAGAPLRRSSGSRS